MKEMGKEIDFKLLQNFSEGRYSWNDYLKVKKWVSNPYDFRNLEGQFYNQWINLTETEQSESGSLHHLFEKIHYQILLEEKQNNKSRNLWNYYRQAAAFLLIPVLLFSILGYLFSKKPQPASETWAQINVPDGARVEFFLPDSSRGWLNSGSTLKYPPVFDLQRRVELKGEAFFEIKHLYNSDFTVSVADLDVKVLGTKFDISAYPTDRFTDVILKDGKVSISGKAGVFNYTMTPGEKINFNRDTKSFEARKVETDQYSAWKDGYLILDNEPLGQVIGKLERWYNAEIVVQDEILKKYRFKATFLDEPLEEVLRLLALTTPISYKIEKRGLDQQGVFKKKKVTIKLK
jgi:ferric-dicitrate binding protein FerR (iron transport regulator)